VSHELLGLEAVSLGPISVPAPPIFVGGASDDILALISRAADGWHNAQEADPAQYAALRSRLLRFCEAEGRTRPLRTAVQLNADGLSPQVAAQQARAFARAGADALTFLFVRDRDPDVLCRFAEHVL
jgi:Luciferase-like monooxygenase